MPHQALDDHKVCSCFHLKASEGMPCTMETDVLGDTCRLYPLFKRDLRQLVAEIRKYKPPFIGIVVYKFQNFLADGIMNDVFCLLHPDCHIHDSAIAIGLYVIPLQCLDIAFPQSRQAGKQECGFRTDDSHGVAASFTSSCCDKCCFSVGMVSIRSRNPLGFSLILRSL